MRPLAILVLTMVLAAGMASPATSADEALQPPIADAEQDVSDDYDPWQRFNEKMFFLNHDSCMTFATRSRRSRSLLDPCS